MYFNLHIEITEHETRNPILNLNNQVKHLNLKNTFLL